MANLNPHTIIGVDPEGERFAVDIDHSGEVPAQSPQILHEIVDVLLS